MNMKIRDFADAQIIINGIKAGQLTRRDLVALLIYVREHVPNDIVKDIAHCVAHSDRDRGYVYSHIESFVQSVMSLAAQGSGTLSVDPVFAKDRLIDTMAKDLADIGFNVNRVEIENNYGIIKACLSDILTNTTIKLADAKVRQCTIEEGLLNGRNILAFSVVFQHLDPSIFHIPPNVGLAFPVFSD
jgi:hypothetical protein